MNRSVLRIFQCAVIGSIILLFCGSTASAQMRSIDTRHDSLKVRKVPKTAGESTRAKDAALQKGPHDVRGPVHPREPLKPREPIARNPIELHPPSLIAPRSGSKFNFYPRHTELKWKSVAGAKSYMVEVEYNDNKWEPYIKQSVHGTAYKFDFVGEQPGP